MSAVCCLFLDVLHLQQRRGSGRDGHSADECRMQCNQQRELLQELQRGRLLGRDGDGACVHDVFTVLLSRAV